jgi:epoxide hydrolase 4
VRGIILGLGYERCVLVAHDWGGMIAWTFADAYPDLVERLIVMNCPHPAKFFAGLKTPQQRLRSWYILFFQLPWLPELLLQAENYKAIGELFSGTAIDRAAFTPADLDAYKQAAAKPGALTAMLNYYRANFSSNPAWNNRNWSVLPMPTLLVWGEADRALGKELTYGTELYVANLTVRYLPQCSHWVQQEQPQVVNQHMREFLRQGMAL